MLHGIIVAVARLRGGSLAVSKPLAASSHWHATVTPLASMMGSGFLVAWRLYDRSRRRLRLATCACLAVLCWFVCVLGLPSE